MEDGDSIDDDDNLGSNIGDTKTPTRFTTEGGNFPDLEDGGFKRGEHRSFKFLTNNINGFRNIKVGAEFDEGSNS